MNITTKAALLAAVAKFDPTKDPAAHVTIIQKAARDLDALDHLPAEGVLAVAKADTKTAELVREIAVLKMAPAVRKHFDALGADAQTAFLAKDDAGRQAEVDAIEKGDPILYTCTDGTEIRKSDGAAALIMAKRLDAQDKVIKGLQESGAGDRFAKRAATEFTNVATETAVNMLKSVDALGADSDGGKAVMASLNAMQKAQGGLFKSLGSTETTEHTGDIAKAKVDWDGAVETIAKRDGKGMAEAMSKARSEHPDLFKAAYPNRPEVEA